MIPACTPIENLRRRDRFFGVLVCLIAAFCPLFGHAGQKRNATSTDVETYARGCSDVEGYLLGEHDEFKVLTAKCGAGYEAWLTKFAANNGGQQNSEEIVLDHLRIRPLVEGETFSSGPYCYKNSKSVKWVAIYVWGNRKKISGDAIHDAWVVNLKAVKFEPATRELKMSVVCTAAGE